VRFITLKKKQKGDKYGCKGEEGMKAAGEGKREEEKQILKKEVNLQHSQKRTKLHGAEPFLRSRQLPSCARMLQRVMELKGSLPCSQQSSTGPNLEPDQSSPYDPIQFL
jgi:hypothetical protein